MDSMLILKISLSKIKGKMYTLLVNATLNFQLLRKCILNMSNPTIEGPLGNPPFEKPSIAKVCVIIIRTFIIILCFHDRYVSTRTTV
jgi:hypothetical protein